MILTVTTITTFAQNICDTLNSNTFDNFWIQVYSMPEQMSDTTAQNTTQNASPTSTGTASPGSEAKTFTQADLDRLIEERVGRADKRDAKVKADLLKELGLADGATLDDLKATITKARELEAANLSATEKIQRELEAEKKRAADLQAKWDAERTARINQVLDAAVRDAAKTSPDPSLVLMYTRQEHADQVAALMSEDGKIDEKKLAALMDTVKKEKPLLFTTVKGGGGNPSDRTGKPVDPDAKTKERAAAQTRAQIRSGF